MGLMLEHLGCDPDIQILRTIQIFNVNWPDGPAVIPYSVVITLIGLQQSGCGLWTSIGRITHVVVFVE